MGRWGLEQEGRRINTRVGRNGEENMKDAVDKRRYYTERILYGKDKIIELEWI